MQWAIGHVPSIFLSSPDRLTLRAPWASVQASDVVFSQRSCLSPLSIHVESWMLWFQTSH